MTLKVTISHSNPGYPMHAVVKQSNGNPDTRISDGGSAEFYVHSGNSLTVVEVAAEAGGNAPLGGGGPGEERVR